MRYSLMLTFLQNLYRYIMHHIGTLVCGRVLAAPLVCWELGKAVDCSYVRGPGYLEVSQVMLYLKYVLIHCLCFLPCFA